MNAIIEANLPLILSTIVLVLFAGLTLYWIQRQFAQRQQEWWQQRDQLSSQLEQASMKEQQAQLSLNQHAQIQVQLKTQLENLHARERHTMEQFEASQHQLNQQRENNQLINSELSSALATLEEYKKDRLRLEQKESLIDDLNQELSLVKTRLKQEQVEREKDQQNLEEKIQFLQENREQLKQEFENLSNKIYEAKQKQFSEQSKQGLDSLLNPFKIQLDGLRKKVDDVYVEESKDRAALKAQIGELHKLNKQITEEAASLTRALKGEKKTQGNWGELVLENVLEKSGLRQGEEFVREKSITSEVGDRYRPDVIINLPENKHIIVDAKVSLNAYTDYINAETDADRQQYLKNHIDAVRVHIKRLSEKDYSKLPGVNSPDFVFMFMPVEPAFMVAFQYDDKLFNDAFEQRIVVVTPTTLLASLRTVSNLWSIERQNKNARQLAEQAGKIHDKLVVFVESMEKVGSQLGTAQNTYEKAWSQLKEGRGNLVSQAHKFKDLGVRVKKELPSSVMDNAELEFQEDLIGEI